MSARPHDSLARLWLLASLAGVAVMMGYVTLFWDSSQPAMLLRTLDDVAVDFSARQPRNVRYDATGKAVRFYSADHLTHYRDGDRSELVRPVFEVIDEDGVVWRSNSREGTLISDDLLELRGDVVVADAATTTQLQTQALRWNAATQQLASDLPVVLIRQTHTVRGIGLRADLEQDRVEILAQVEGLHVIP